MLMTCCAVLPLPLVGKSRQFTTDEINDEELHRVVKVHSDERVMLLSIKKATGQEEQAGCGIVTQYTRWRYIFSLIH